MEEWIKTGSGKKIKMLSDGKVVVVAPEDTSNIIPLFCSCCEFPMRNADDSVSYRKYGICSKCDSRWTSKPGIEWPNGPEKTTKEWQEYIENRLTLEKPVINFK